MFEIKYNIRIINIFPKNIVSDYFSFKMCYTYRISEIIKRKKKMKNKRKKADWLTIIPILFWLSCMLFR